MVVSPMTKGFMLGFSTSSTMILIYTVHDIAVNKTHHSLCDQENVNGQNSLITEENMNGQNSLATGANVNGQRSLVTEQQKNVQSKLRSENINFDVKDRPTSNPRILCWVMTSPDTLYVRAKHVKNTWGRRCDLTLFFSSSPDPQFPCIGLNITEGRKHLWGKTKQAFEYIFKHHFNDFDWFMKADDDTYVIVENLRHFLSKRKPNDPVYYGHHFKDSGSVQRQYKGYNSGGSGYVLSKEALKRFGENSTRPFCPDDGPEEDLRMGACLNKLGVKTMNTSDEVGLMTFFCFEIDLVIFGKYPSWYIYRGTHSKQSGIGNFSRNAISFHYVKPHMMYLLDFFIYRFKLRTEYSNNDAFTLLQNDWVLKPTATSANLTAS